MGKAKIVSAPPLHPNSPNPHLRKNCKNNLCPLLFYDTYAYKFSFILYLYAFVSVSPLSDFFCDTYTSTLAISIHLSMPQSKVAVLRYLIFYGFCKLQRFLVLLKLHPIKTIFVKYCC